MTPGVYLHTKSQKLVLVRCDVVLQDDVDGGHGPYDSEVWVLYEHDGKAYARKVEAFTSRFTPHVFVEDDHNKCITQEEWLAGLSPLQRVLSPIAGFIQTNITVLATWTPTVVAVVAATLITTDWRATFLLYAAVAAGVLSGRMLSLRTLYWGGNIGPSIKIPYSIAETLTHNEWVPLRENPLGGLSEGDYDQSPVDHHGTYRCPRCSRSSHEKPHRCPRGDAIRWLRGALADASK